MRLNDRRTLGRLTLLLATALIAAGCTGSTIGQTPTPTLSAVAPGPAAFAISQPSSTPPEAQAIGLTDVVSAATASPSPSTTALPASPTPETTGGSLAVTDAQATSSMQHMLATAEAPASPEPSPDAMAQHMATTPTAALTVLYQDHFTDPKSGWPDELLFQNYYVGYHEPDFYHVEVHVPNDSAIVTAPGQSFDNYQAETQVAVSMANTAPIGDFRYGLVVRRSGNQYYAFTISPRTKTWYVLKSGSGSLKALAQGTQETIRGLEALDSLRVNADGPVLTFYVNDQIVSQVSDPDYTGGEVGFYVETFDSPKAHAHFHNLVVSQPMSPPPEPPALTVLYQDHFTDPKSGWPDELLFQNYYVGYHEPDFYHVEVHVPNDSAIVTAPGQSFDNYQAETQVAVSMANTAPIGDFRYGLVVRRSGNQYYAFTISPRTKTWYVLKSGSGSLKVLAQGTQETIRGLEALDSLRVNADGPVLTFYVNDQIVSQVSDPDYTGGEVGFYVETFDSPKAHAHFHNLVVSQPMSPPPEPPALTVLYQDHFTDPKSGWPDELLFQNYYVGYHEPDFYHVEVHVPNDSAIVTAPGQSFDNYQAETQVAVSMANTAPIGDFRYGLVVRRSGNQYYAFTISPRTKTWYVLKSGSGSLKALAQGTQETIRGLEALDSLRVNADGPVLTFYVNDQIVSQVSDPDYTGGEVGFYVETFDSPKAHAHFHNLVVSQPMNAPPEASSTAPVLTCAVTADLLKLRQVPNGGEAPTIAGLFKGTQLEAFGRNVDGSWIRVRLHGGTQEGWVSALPALVTCDGSIASLDVS